MVKVDYSRDYYVDLEVAPDAPIEEIKKQFRKLALKYHPDRNPGKELEYNPRFQAIQAAHEVLGDPEQRRKYDSNRQRGDTFGRPVPATPRGNPYQARSDFPPPPMRTNNNNRTSANAGAERYTNFGPPPTRKEKPSATYDAKERANAFNAWSHMQSQKPQTTRPQAYSQSSGYQSQSSRPRQQETSTDGANSSRRSTSDETRKAAYEEVHRSHAGMNRTASTRGSARSGFDPTKSSTDERQAPSNGYYERPTYTHPPFAPPPPPETTYSHPPFPPPPPPDASRPRPMPGSYQDSTYSARSEGTYRQTPTARRPEHTVPAPTPTSNMRVPVDPPFVEATRVRTPYVAHSEEKTFFGTGTGRSPTSPRKSSADDLYGSASQAGKTRQPRRHSSSPLDNGADNSTKKQTGFDGTSSRPFVVYSSTDSSEADGESATSLPARPKAQPSASWKKNRASAPPLGPAGRSNTSQVPGQNHTEQPTSTGRPHPTIFTFPFTPETLESDAPSRAQSPGSNIDLKFAKSDGHIPFSSNATAANDESQKASPADYFPNRGRETDRAEDLPQAETMSPDLLSPKDADGQSIPANDGRFSADHWNQQLQDDNWAAKWAQGPPNIRISPTRNSANSRKQRGAGFRAPSSDASGIARQPTTPQPASIEEEETGDPDQFTGSRPVSRDEDDAMDIDSSPPAVPDGRKPTTADTTSQAEKPPSPLKQQQQQPRHIYVEPTRTEWHERPHIDERRQSFPVNIPSPVAPFSPSEEVPRAQTLSMNDFRHVPPFQTKPLGTGLDDLGDMTNGLPFESRPSTEHPDKSTVQTGPELPKIPRAPYAPTKLDHSTWQRYLEHFAEYISAWHAVNKQMTDYFSARATQQIEMEKGPEGGMVVGWVAAVGETALLGGWDTYCRLQQEEQRMRVHWQVSCERFRAAMDVHTKLREKVMRDGLQ